MSPMKYKYVICHRQCDGCFAPELINHHWYCEAQPIKDIYTHKAEIIDGYMFSSEGTPDWCPLVEDKDDSTK